jgi:XTP/dITP diphosphohydrolase
MKKWVFATNNQHKLEEAKQILGDFAEIVSLKEIGFFDEVDETADTFEGNATIKAQSVFEKTGIPCFADDSGLCVNALNGAPGVKSARYANDHGPVDHFLNNQKLLAELTGIENREAFFITVICAVGFTESPLYFNGEVHGDIATDLSGVAGFGYDPLFIPKGYSKTFAELGSEIKNSMSHRANALNKMKIYFSE